MSRKRNSRKRSESRARYYIREEVRKRGWNINHVGSGGDILEENEIIAYFPELGLELDKPDFLLCLKGEPAVIIEAKNKTDLINTAINEAIEYVEKINQSGKYNLKFAVGAAGEEDTGFVVEVCYLSSKGWTSLTSLGFEITTIPSQQEVELALIANDGTTSVSIPASHEFIDAAIEVSSLLRAAKIEAPLRPKVIGAIVLAMYQGQVDTTQNNALNSINNLVEIAINSTVDINFEKKAKLIDALRLSGADFDRLEPSIKRLISILRRLNIRVVLQTDTDFLGLFYEAFLRYGYDNNSLGIVFTPRHITRFCVELLGVNPSDRIIDIACGTGGFLVAAYDQMISAAKSPASINKVKSSLTGFDTNPTVWSLAMLNMFFRGDGKSNLEYASCLDSQNREAVKDKFTRSFLNPPFSQENEPEEDFINAAMDALEPAGMMAAVVKAGIFADSDHSNWRKQFLREHSLLAIISLPEDLFYPTAVPTSIIVAQAHIPMSDNKSILMARVWNDGYEKLKGRRIERTGSQIPEIKQLFDQVRLQETISSNIATSILGLNLKKGEDWSPQQWLPQPPVSPKELNQQQQNIIRSIYQSVAEIPDLADEVLENFTLAWADNPNLPLGTHQKIKDFFEVVQGRSIGEKHYTDGTCPYISSGESHNSIIRLVSYVDSEVFQEGGITVTAFGTASVQPWAFMARGNGGSAVRVLLPKYNMSFRELVWFAAQINLQRWRIFYARMAIKSRLEQLEVSSLPHRLRDPENNNSIANNIKEFRNNLDQFSRISW